MKENRTSKLIKNSIILAFGQFLPKIMALITLPILTATLSTEQYGIYDLLLSAEGILMPLMTLQLQQGVFRKLIQQENDRSRIIASAYKMLLVVYALWLPVIFSLLRFVVKWSDETAALISIFYVVYSSFDVLSQTVRGLGENVKYSIGIVLYSLINTIALVLCFYFYTITIQTIIALSLVSYVIASAFYFASCRFARIVDFRVFDSSALKNILSYSIPIIPGTISLWIVNLSDRLLVSFFLGTGMNGIYAVANKIPGLFASVYSVFNLAWTDTASRVMDLDNDSDEYYSKMFDAMYRMLTGVMLLLISFSPVLFSILIGESYYSATSQMPILFLGVFFNCIVSFYGGIYIAKQITKQVGISSFVGAVLNFVINLALINKIGLFAASISTLVSYFAIAAYRAIDLKKCVRIIYNKKSILICSAFLSLFALCSSLNAMWMNVFLLAIAIVFNLVVNKKIISFLAEATLSKLVKTR